MFSTLYQDIYKPDFQSFVKADETWKNPFTFLKSTITFMKDSYEANVLIANEFSIVEFSIKFEPDMHTHDNATNL